MRYEDKTRERLASEISQLHRQLVSLQTAERARHRQHLEETVRERTEELNRANHQLKQEAARRRLIEEALWGARSVMKRC